MTYNNLRLIKQRLLVHEARKWLNFIEYGGDNKGQAVEMFQKVVDNKAAGEPWCLAFIMYCIREVDKLIDEIFLLSMDHRSKLFETEHCLTCWNKTPHHLRIVKPEPGAIVIWQLGLTIAGHAGITQKSFEIDWFDTVEGNTGPTNGIETQRDGVFEKARSMDGMGAYKILGFIRPWEDLEI